MFVVTDSLATPAALTYTLNFTDPDNSSKAGDDKKDISHDCKFKHPIFTNGDDHWYAGETIKDTIFMLDTN